jgi:hypothetical protein
MEKKRKARRSLQERAKDIFEFINKQEKVFPKSRLKEIGLSAASAESWFKLIEYIQNQPKIRIVESENNVLIERVEGNYQALIRSKILDESIPFDQRIQLNADYLKSQYHRELSQGSMVSSAIIHEKSKEIFDAIKIVSLIDSHFSEEIKMIEKIDSIQDLGDKDIEIRKTSKILLYGASFRKKFNEFLENGLPYNKILEIERKIPDYRDQLDQAIKLIKNDST